MRIAVFASSFPILSETFILNHVHGLLERGHDLRVFTFRKGPDIAHPRAQIEEIVSVVQTPPSPTRNPLRRLGKAGFLEPGYLAKGPTWLPRPLKWSHASCRHDRLRKEA